LGGCQDAALAGAAIPLSAARFPEVAAAGAEFSDFQPVVAKKQMGLGGPGEGGVKVREKIPKTGPASMHEIPLWSPAGGREGAP